MLDHAVDENQVENGSGQKTGLIRDGVYEKIRADILTCVLAPGSRVFENDLAQRYNVSKSPVRDALLRLQEQGLIDVLPRKGYLIRPISIGDAHDLYEMRLLLEKSCIRRACDEASDEELASLDKFRSVENGDLAHWVTYNRDFHRRIAELSGNARMAKMAQEVIDQFDRLTFVGVSAAPSAAAAEKFVTEHCEIIDALQAHDRSTVTSLINKHISKSQKQLFAVLENPPIVE
ncbi:MAG: GntR family transcriptional regulator [Rhodospirillaceae bacterium]|jgi:GntR family transcriptional regulator, rspAB operon transcriptional repressor|nr:GntR family transcriptional regulator [Rhodospirillaceae bacterium]MBT7955019.1 GntR family transcriptional regulator [Rhodospirillaceae bacterium]